MRVIEIETGRRVDLKVADGCFSRVAEAATVGEVSGWVLPGLVDVHNHLSLASPAGEQAEPGERHLTALRDGATEPSGWAFG